MDWSDERYVRVYTRDTPDMLAVGWQGRAVLYELLRKVDRAGVLDHGGDLDVVAELLRLPVEVFEAGIGRLSARRVVELGPTAIVIPNFIAAQEVKKTDRQRQIESRERRRAMARLATAAVDNSLAHSIAPADDYSADVSRNVTDLSRNVTPESQNVTDRHASHEGCHAVTKSVTPFCSVPFCSVPDIERAAPALVLAESSGAVVAKKARKPPHPDFPRARARWESLYLERYGSAPSRGAKQNGQLSALLNQHGGDEVIRRMERLMNGKLKWPRDDDRAYDLGTLAQHFDALAVRVNGAQPTNAGPDLA